MEGIEKGMYITCRSEYLNFLEKIEYNPCDYDQNLLELIFYRIKLKNIPEFIYKLKKIKTLQFYNSDFVFITEEFFNLKTLVFLKFSFNTLKYIPYNFGNLINLRTFSLHLACSQLVHINFHIFKMKNLNFWENSNIYSGIFSKIKSICLFV